MPRRREVPKREILPDPKYGNVELSKFMNVIMEGGKKAVAERIIYGALETMEQKTGKDPLELFTIAINNVKPMVEVKSRRVGGANYQVPVEVRPVRRMALSMRWLREAANKRSEKSMPQRLAGELMEAAEGRGGAMKRRDEVHRMAEANKAFSHVCIEDVQEDYRRVNRILDDFVKAVQPRKLTLVGEFTPRGGISSVLTVEYSSSVRSWMSALRSEGMT